jgi:hypothetical protein
MTLQYTQIFEAKQDKIASSIEHEMIDEKLTFKLWKESAEENIKCKSCQNRIMKNESTSDKRRRHGLYR